MPEEIALLIVAAVCQYLELLDEFSLEVPRDVFIANCWSEYRRHDEVPEPARSMVQNELLERIYA